MEVDDGRRKDDEAHLTAHMTHAGMPKGTLDDPENEAGRQRTRGAARSATA
jgi:hypothetical protein